MDQTCDGCRNGDGFGVPITMAFQPIVDTEKQQVFAYEALVRGTDGAGAMQILSHVNDTNRYAFDQKCRVTAIGLAAELGLHRQGAMLSINFLPRAVYEPMACIRLTLKAARAANFPVDNILFEFCESERMDTEHILNILQAYRGLGFRTAIDDFGAGYAGLGLLSRFQPDFVKIDMDLVRDIDRSTAKQTILRHTVGMLTDLGITPIVEGVETAAEATVVRETGVSLIQGYAYGKPALACLSAPEWPDVSAV